jgi:hypothetical protein
MSEPILKFQTEIWSHDVFAVSIDESHNVGFGGTPSCEVDTVD